LFGRGTTTKKKSNRGGKTINGEDLVKKTDHILWVWVSVRWRKITATVQTQKKKKDVGIM